MCPTLLSWRLWRNGPPRRILSNGRMSSAWSGMFELANQREGKGDMVGGSD